MAGGSYYGCLQLPLLHVCDGLEIGVMIRWVVGGLLKMSQGTAVVSFPFCFSNIYDLRSELESKSHDLLGKESFLMGKKRHPYMDGDENPGRGQLEELLEMHLLRTLHCSLLLTRYVLMVEERREKREPSYDHIARMKTRLSEAKLRGMVNER